MRFVCRPDTGSKPASRIVRMGVIRVTIVVNNVQKKNFFLWQQGMDGVSDQLVEMPWSGLTKQSKTPGTPFSRIVYWISKSWFPFSPVTLNWYFDSTTSRPKDLSRSLVRLLRSKTKRLFIHLCHRLALSLTQGKKRRQIHTVLELTYTLPEGLGRSVRHAQETVPW